ncbi:MAG: dihydropteroate synthase [Betaproteobacteria bacterium]|nr:dihydropteroate synthase [Betaproteobacteria bacterium]MDE2122514.1 dihydropteroate synthase [Betaproteobacteria bacterium]MDE2185888.1 dihydropteroate synthase [Betaproteobacteria bacterium]
MLQHWLAGRFQLALSRPLVMGIVNVTPDSFSDGGQHSDARLSIRHASRLLEEGADILDIGGESTRPGSTPVDADTEWTRIEPVLREAVLWGVPVSVDSYRPQTMRRALDLGVDIINDVYALRMPGAQAIVSASQAGICLMHMQGEPGTMQLQPQYGDVIAEVRSFLLQRVADLLALGIPAARLCLDPGFGFGKSLAHNMSLARGLETLTSCGYPVLVGVSRKSMIGGTSGRPVAERLPGSLAAALACVAAGACIVRAHDVAATVDALKVWTAMRG